MRSLKSLIDWLPYYFKESDTYKDSEGKGLLERYLQIFGDYFDDIVIGDINTIGDVLDISNTPEIYLGYLWEFLGAMPYANPHAIDPEKWKILFSQFGDSSTEDFLKAYYVYPVNTYNNGTADHFDLTGDQVRALIKYSIALFSIRGTEKFFRILLKLYGLNVTIGNYHYNPNLDINSELDYFVNTKLDTELSQLDHTKLDNTQLCTTCTTVDFTISTSDGYTYTTGTNEFIRLYHRMYNLLDTFLPLGVRPHIKWGNVYDVEIGGIVAVYDPKAYRYCELYIDRPYTGWTPSDTKLVLQDDGWYKYSSQSSYIANFYENDGPIKVKVKVVESDDYGVLGPNGRIKSSDPKTFKAKFYDEWSEDFESGHIFNIYPTDSNLTPAFKPSAINDDEYVLGTVNLFTVNWNRLFNYEMFKWFNSSVDTRLSNNNTQVSIIIQSAIAYTDTNNADVSDDTFVPQQVLNVTTGNLLTLVPGSDNCTYIDTLTKPGLYTYQMVSRPEHTLTISIVQVEEVLTVSVIGGSSGTVTKDEPVINTRIVASSNINLLKYDQRTKPIFGDGIIGSDIITYYGPYNNLPYFSNDYINLDSTVNTFTVAYLKKPVHDHSQYIDIKHYHDNQETVYRINLIRGSLTRISGPAEDIGSSIAIGNQIENKAIEMNNTIIDSEYYNIRTINVSFNHYDIYVETLYDPFILIKETSNPDTQYWNNGELISLDDPGHYRFYAESLTNKYSGDSTDFNVSSSKYNVKYYIELRDGDRSDDEEYMLRTKASFFDSVTGPARIINQASIYFIITTDLSYIAGHELDTEDPGGLDFEINLYRGSVPIISNFITSITATLSDITGETVERNHYRKIGKINFQYEKGNYLLKIPSNIDDPRYAYDVPAGHTTGNLPPGTYCIELHAKDSVWDGQPTYRVVDIYEIPDQADRNLYFDVDVINRAWTSPAGQYYNTDPFTGKRTWGWYKTNPDQAWSVRFSSYDPGIDIPLFRLKLTNNDLSYSKVYLYKRVSDGSSWDIDKRYPDITTDLVTNGGHWLPDIGDDWKPSETAKWLFTGSIYNLNDLIQGPTEPGKYIFMINQLDSNLDKKNINYAYLEVKEEIDYTLIINPSVAILQGTAVLTNISVVSSAKFTNEILKVKVKLPNNEDWSTDSYGLPYDFYAYQPGVYTFGLFRYEEGEDIPVLDKGGNHIVGTFRVLTDNGISDEYLYWEWNSVVERPVTIATTSTDINWTIKLQDQD